MIFKKENIDPIDHQVNLETLHEMEDYLPMTLYERGSLRKWVYSGHDPEKNPWNYLDEDGWYMNYLEAYRYHHGYKLICNYKILEG